MIQSMTGFGRGEAANEKYKVTIEMKSVNVGSSPKKIKFL